MADRKLTKVLMFLLIPSLKLLAADGPEEKYSVAITVYPKETADTKEAKEDAKFSCRICIDTLAGDDLVIFDLPCSHRFHALCLAKSLHRNPRCPLCREKTREDALAELGRKYKLELVSINQGERRSIREQHRRQHEIPLRGAGCYRCRQTCFSCMNICVKCCGMSLLCAVSGGLSFLIIKTVYVDIFS